MPPVVHVVSVVDVIHIDIVSPVPGWRPGFRTRIDHAEPVTTKLETRGSFDHYDGDVMHAEPVSAAKMGAKAIFGDAISVVAAAGVPGAMLVLPIMCALALPDVLPSRPGPADLAHVRRTMPVVCLMLRASLHCVMEFARLLVPVFRPVGVMVAMLRRGWVRVSVVRVSFLSVGTTLMLSRPAVLCAGKYCGCEK